MTSAKSLGVHLPAALDFLTQESLLPSNPDESLYRWDTYNDISSGLGDEEVITTDRCVVWSQGGVIQRVFRLDPEEQDIIQALLTWFNVEEHEVTDFNGTNPTKPSRVIPSFNSSASEDDVDAKVRGRTRSRALVVILRHQAHVYLLNGSSHISNLPIEVERAFPIPSGLVLQQIAPGPDPSPLSPDPPAAPPSSFNLPQHTVLASPRLQDSIGVKDSHSSPGRISSPLSLENFAIKHKPGAATTMPHLFAMTDPLVELALVFESSHNLEHSPTLHPMNPQERVVHVSPLYQTQSKSSEKDQQWVIMVTANRDRQCYSVWYGSNLDAASLNERLRTEITEHKPLLNQHRSSKVSRSSVGGNTPSALPRAGNSESMTTSIPTSSFFAGSNGTPKRTSGSFNLDRGAPSDDDFAIGPDISSPAKKSAANRRTSSILARAELSTHELNPYKDWSHNASGPASNSTYGRVQRSFGERKNLASASTPGRQSSATIRTGDEDDSMRTDASHPIASGETKSEADLQRGSKLGSLDPLDPLRKNLVFGKAFDVPLSTSSDETVSNAFLMKSSDDTEVFATTAPCGTVLSIFLLNRCHSVLLEICIHLREASMKTAGEKAASSTATFPSEFSSHVMKSFAVHTTNDVLDAIKLVDGGVSALAVLRRGLNGTFNVCLLSSRAQSSGSPISEEHSSSLRELETMEIRLDDHLDPSCSSKLRKQDSLARYVVGSSVRADMLSPLTTTNRKLRHPGLLGEFDIVGVDGFCHRYQVQLRPRDGYVKKILDFCQLAIWGSRRWSLLSTWWRIHGNCSSTKSRSEWKSLVITIFTLVIPHVHTDDANTYNCMPSLRQSYALEASRMQAQSSTWSWILTEASADSAEKLSDKFILECITAAREYLEAQNEVTNPHSHTPLSQGTGDYASRLAELLLGLHLIHEEEKLNVNSAETCGADSRNLAPVLAQLGQWFGWTSWTGEPGQYYSLGDNSSETWEYEKCSIKSFSVPPPPFDPPSVYEWIKQTIKSPITQDFPTAANLFRAGVRYTKEDDKGLNRQDEVNSEFIPRLTAITALLKDVSQQHHLRQLPVKAVLKRHLNFEILETLPEGIVAILRSHIARWKSVPLTNLPSFVLKYIGLEDIHLLQDHQYSADVENLDRYICARFSGLDVRSVCSSNLTNPIRLDLRGPSEVMKIIFRDDTRSSEPAIILCPQLVPVAIMHPTAGCSEAQFLEAQQNHAKLIYTRTMAVVSGQALLEYHCHRPLPTQKLEILLFNTSCRMQPSGITVNADRSNFVEEKVSWAFFHAGVQTGLRITKDAKDLDTSWLFLNKPAELGNRHAGLLLALGLNGHLKPMAKWLAFKYLTPKHDMTSIGLLLGWSASHFGSMDSLITRVLSVHLESLLPAGSAELNLSPLVQAAATMGVGLLYYNSQHRRMSEKMLLEMEHVDPEVQLGTTKTFNRNEGYRLAAGFALGFINLGKGTDLRALRGLRIEERLMQLATGPYDISIVHILDQATAGATIATALIFMKTHMKEVARKIGIPHTVKQFDNIRPDLLLLRVVAKNLIMWRDISPRHTWIWESLPEDLQLEMRPVSFSVLGTKTTVLDFIMGFPLSSRNLSLYNILAGLCWSIALKHAGSSSLSARDCLLAYYDKVTSFLAHVPQSYDERVTRDALMRFQHLLILATATVMAGTGDLAVLSRLRVLHSTVTESSTFGFHQASHMAMGALFIGQGRFTFSTSNLAIASLLCAFYPIFPVEVLDNRAHLQAFRHFWVFAAEARCILPRDAETNETIITPVEIFLRDSTRQTIMAPALLPDLDTIAQIATISDEYWRVMLDFENNPNHLTSFRKHHTIFLRRKSLLTQYRNQFSVKLAARIEPKLSKYNGANAFEWVFHLQALRSLGIGISEARSIFTRRKAREERGKKRLFLIEEGKDPALDSEEAPPITNVLDAMTTGIDDTLVMNDDVESCNRDRLMGLSILFEWSQTELRNGRRLVWEEWIGEEAVTALRAAVLERMGIAAEVQELSADVEGAGWADSMAVD